MTNKSKWTAGPWFYRSFYKDTIVDANLETIVHDEYGLMDTDNANLIVAAPDLYDALEKIVNSGDWFLTALEIDLYKENPIDGEELEALARMALAKARGETL